MDNNVKSKSKVAFLFQLITRILSAVSIGIILLFFLGEGFNYKLIKPNEWILLLFFPLGVFIGMIIAWWKEGLGGSVSVGSLAMFYIIHFVTSGKFPHGWAWLIFTIPGFFFLLCWILAKKERVSQSAIDMKL